MQHLKTAYDISKELLNSVKEDVIYTYIQGIKITTSNKVGEEYYLSMASQMIIDTLKLILIDHPLEENIILNLTFEGWENVEECLSKKKNPT